jgi:methylglutaconyl-CoA hydratase
VTAVLNATLYHVAKGAAWLTMNRPEQRNALSAALVSELAHHLEAANADPAVRCIVLTGTDPAFCAGADLKSPPGQGGTSFPQLLHAIVKSPKPVIAAVNGQAFGGGLGLVGAADLVISADEADFCFSEVRLGVIPAIISVVCVPKLGQALATQLFLTAERFQGPKAVGYGLANESVPRAQLHAAVEAMVASIAKAGPIAIQEAKRLVQQVPNWSLEVGLQETAVWSRRLFTSPEAAEGMAAFREKRAPAWQLAAKDESHD